MSDKKLILECGDRIDIRGHKWLGMGDANTVELIAVVEDNFDESDEWLVVNCDDPSHFGYLFMSYADVKDSIF